MSFLPLHQKDLIGREIESEQVARLFREPNPRLITLTGPGGSGKTSLAIRVAELVSDHFADRVWWIDLSGIRRADEVMPVVVAALGLPRHESRSPVERIAAHLRGCETLLILDN